MLWPRSTTSTPRARAAGAAAGAGRSDPTGPGPGQTPVLQHPARLEHGGQADPELVPELAERRDPVARPVRPVLDQSGQPVGQLEIEAPRSESGSRAAPDQTVYRNNLARRCRAGKTVQVEKWCRCLWHGAAGGPYRGPDRRKDCPMARSITWACRGSDPAARDGSAPSRVTGRGPPTPPALAEVARLGGRRNGGSRSKRVSTVSRPTTSPSTTRSSTRPAWWGAAPIRHRLAVPDDLDTYFSLARGTRASGRHPGGGTARDDEVVRHQLPLPRARARSRHEVQFDATKPLDEFAEAREPRHRHPARPPRPRQSFCCLSNEPGAPASDRPLELARRLLARLRASSWRELSAAGAEWVQLDEPVSR